MQLWTLHFVHALTRWGTCFLFEKYLFFLENGLESPLILFYFYMENKIRKKTLSVTPYLENVVREKPDRAWGLDYLSGRYDKKTVTPL